MLESSTLVEQGARLVEAARDAGADHAEVYVRQGRSTRMTFQHDYVNESAGGQGGLALRVWCGDRQALLTTDGLAAAQVADLAQRAVTLARRHGIPQAPLLRAGPDGRQFAAPDERVSHADAVGEIARMLEALRCNPAFERAIINACYTDESWNTALANSCGLVASHQSRRHALWVWIEGMGGHTTASIASRRWSELALDQIYGHLNEQAALLAQPASPAPTGPCEVLLSPLAAAHLARSLGSLLLAENVLRDLRRLLDYIGRAIAAPAVTLIDDSTLADGLKSRPVDDEGTPTEATVLIERGELRALLHTLATAQQLGVAPNGKAVRPALWDQPHAAASNIYLRAGDAHPAELRRSIRRGLIVEGVMRPGRIQSSNGTFTLVVHGQWVEAGVPVRRVSGVPLSANIFKLLRGVRQCGADLHFSLLADGAGAPSVLVEHMQVG